MPTGNNAGIDNPHNYYNNPPSTAWMVSVADSVGLGLATIFVAARCYTKFFITRAPGWEDSTPSLTSTSADFSLTSLATFIAFVAFDFVQRFQYCGGRHIYDLPPSCYNGFFWTGVADSYLYILGVTIAKLSLLFFLYRIFRVDTKFRIASWVIGTILVIWTTVTILLGIFACRPIKASWILTVYLDPKTVCPITFPNVVNVHGFCNIITDFALLFLPVPMVWNLQMNIRKKIGLAMVFATGILYVPFTYTQPKYRTDMANVASVPLPSCASTSSTTPTKKAIRTIKVVPKYGVRLPPFIDPQYPSRLTIPSIVSLEYSFSIIVACLPVLTPLFKKTAILATWLPSLRSKITRSRSGNSNNKQQQQKPSWTSDPDIERNALRSDQQYPAAASSSWRVPQAWKEQEERGFDRYGSGSEDRESDVTLRDLPAHVNHVRVAKGEGGRGEEQMVEMPKE
ncbi:MAG: hypothetical protein Q9222_005978 [Ikaeria aurantiellina]